MQEEVSGATTEGERAPDGFGDALAVMVVMFVLLVDGKNEIAIV